MAVIAHYNSAPLCIGILVLPWCTLIVVVCCLMLVVVGFVVAWKSHDSVDAAAAAGARVHLPPLPPLMNIRFCAALYWLRSISFSSFPHGTSSLSVSFSYLALDKV